MVVSTIDAGDPSRPSRRSAYRLGWKSLLAASLLIGSAMTASPMTVESVTFTTNIVANTTNDRPIELRARLFLPTGPAPSPAVVITPSSAGIRFEREIYYAEELAQAGIGALVIDSFGSRGLSNSVFDQTLLTRWEAANDAIAGLRWLYGDRRFKGDRIGVLGVSKGGIVALDTALTVRRGWMRITDMAFAAHVAIVPGCTWVNSSVSTTGAPIFFMLAELDDVTPAKACVERAQKLKEAGNDRIEFKVYKGAHHAWESLGQRPFFNSKMENFSKCRVTQRDDAAMISISDGKLIPRGRWYEWAKQSCVTRGGHCCGGSPELKRQATTDMIAFLKRSGF